MLRGGNSMTGRVGMKAVAAARTWWAALRPRSRTPASGPALSATTSYTSSYVLMVLAVAMLGCAVAGLAVTLRENSRLAADQHAAMQLVLDEIQGAAGEIDHFDDNLLQSIARRTGLKDLRFDSDDSGISGREMQSLHDSQGRIVGWFSWSPDRTLVRALIWLWGIMAALGAV